jgi:hypothetical protein
LIRTFYEQCGVLQKLFLRTIARRYVGSGFVKKNLTAPDAKKNSYLSGAPILKAFTVAFHLIKVFFFTFQRLFPANPEEAVHNEKEGVSRNFILQDRIW